MTRKKPDIVLLGTGNVAMQLGRALTLNGYKIAQVYSRSPAKAQRAAHAFHAKSTATLSGINTAAAVIVVAVPDRAIPGIVKKIPRGELLVVHTSGSVSMEVFKKRFVNYGVLYPVQTLRKNDTVDFTDIPLCIEASNRGAMTVLKRLARSLSRRVHVMDSSQRAAVHLSAVIANNYTNHLVAVAFEILRAHKLSSNILKPLIAETFAKLNRRKASELQTGPALRGDTVTVRKHLRMLENDPAWRTLYRLLARDIVKRHSPKGKGKRGLPPGSF